MSFKTVAFGLLIMVFGCALAKSPKLQLSIQVKGIEGATLDNVTARLGIIQKSYGKLTVYKIKQFYQEAPADIELAMRPFGYFRASVSSHLSHYKQAYRTVFTVKPGRRMAIKQLDFKVTGEGKKNAAILKAFQDSHLKVGTGLNIPIYKKTKTHLIRIAREEGYLYANFSTDQAEVNLITYQTTLHLTLNTGRRFYFGKFIFSRKTPLSDAFLRRFIHIKPGDPYDHRKLMKLQSDYSSGGYFKIVNLVPQIPPPKSKDNKIPVKVALYMQKKHLYQIGGGYGTASGPRVLFSTSGRWVNAWGNRYNASTIISKSFYQLSGQYIIPGRDPANEYYSLNASIYLMEPPLAGRALVKKFGPGYSWKNGLWSLTTNLNIVFERWRLTDNSPYVNSHLLQPYINLTKISTENPILVENGYKFSIIVAAANKALLSSASYVQPQILFKWIKTLGHNNRFILSAQAGATYSNDKAALPLSERFFAGGQNSLLGFQFQGIGPGYNVALMNLNYQRRISGSFYAGPFYDVGNAYNGNFGNFRKALQRSAGLSVVWRSPVGDISIYWAKVLSLPGKPNRIGFTVGPEL